VGYTGTGWSGWVGEKGGGQCEEQPIHLSAVGQSASMEMKSHRVDQVVPPTRVGVSSQLASASLFGRVGQHTMSETVCATYRTSLYGSAIDIDIWCEETLIARRRCATVATSPKGSVRYETRCDPCNCSMLLAGGELVFGLAGFDTPFRSCDVILGRRLCHSITCVIHLAYWRGV
jgi:hypothetical protein